MSKLKLGWIEPHIFGQKIAKNFEQENWVFLYSGLHKKVKNSRSYIAIFEQEKILCDNFLESKKIIENSDKKWFGYFSYEVGQDFEKMPKTKKSVIALPKIWLANFSVVLEFNHDLCELVAEFDDKKKLEKLLNQNFTSNNEPNLNLEILSFGSNFSNASYLKSISQIKKRIVAGDFYQTNLTRKFFGKFAKKLSHQENFQLFLKLTKLSPANYSSFLKLNKNYVISSSPELFLKIKNRKILSRPIKGTAPRHANLIQDLKNKLNLQKSSKERAENLMIVDLVRNDLARVCKPGSVLVRKLFSITSYQNVHHMSSEISGKIMPNFFTTDAISTCFPPGSMTGTPKIKAIEFAAKKEKLNRGIYSGSIGFLSRREANLNVVIRTLVVGENKFEFQVGGAITFDSNENAELEEIFSKAGAICQILGINLKKIS
jgi:anthranilate/para-aminobenzoate synthase component I